MLLHPTLRSCSLSVRQPQLLLLAVAILLGASCKQQTATPDVSFYYWKTSFALQDAEKNTLHDNKVKRLYVRYFDIAFDAGQNRPLPVGLLRPGTSLPAGIRVTPVVYIKNEVFLKSGQLPLDSLPGQVLRLVRQMSRTAGWPTSGIQFDCDWTETSGKRYFNFLRQFRALSGDSISATIRLHQVKYPAITGVPPADRGMLMLYNMGHIDAGPKNSIYDAATTASYIGNLSAYTLPLDIALPVFSWGIQLRNGAVVHLLNKMDDRHFRDDTCFTATGPDRFRTLHACFKGGYYFYENDVIKIEKVSPGDLRSMAELVTRHSKDPVREVVFYDLDVFNLHNYEKNTYLQTARLFH